MFTKISFLSAYISVHKIICLSETYLNSEILSDDTNLEKRGYNLVREDHPSNSKLGGVCICYKSSLPFRVINVRYLYIYIYIYREREREREKYLCI